MKTIHNAFLIAAIAGANVAVAQTAQPEIKNYWFVAEGQARYHITNCNPHSRVAFYSKTGGGKELISCTTDKQGTLDYSADEDFNPAFALNVKDAGSAGNGNVSFMDQPEFKISHIQITSEDEIATIFWKAATRKNTPIIYTVLKSGDGDLFQVAEQFRPSGNGDEDLFSFTDPNPEPATIYKLSVSNQDEGEHYLSRALLLEDKANVYPTMSAGLFTIESNILNNKSASYCLLNSTGQNVGHGILKSGCNTINITTLAAGVYFVVAIIDGKTQSQKIIKQ